MHFSQAIVQAAERLGVVLPAALLSELRTYPARVPVSLQDKIWQAIHDAWKDPLIGLRIGLEVQAGHLDSTGLLLMSCDTLGDALDALIEYFPIISAGSRLAATVELGGLRLRYQPDYQVLQETRAEAVIGSFVHLSRWMAGGQSVLAEVCLRHAALSAPEDYRRLIGCPVRFQAPDYSLFYPQQALSTPLIQANAAIRESLQRLADEMLASLSTQSLGSQVETLLRRHPGWGKERIADVLGMSGRHLTRRLSDEGTSYKLLRDATLHRMASKRLHRDERLHDIAQDLGFSDESAFAKAFRRWSGLTPAQYRERVRT